MRARSTIVSLLLAGLLASCSEDSLAGSGEPIFGTRDTVCASGATLNEEGDEEIVAAVVDCLLGQMAAGQPVVVDLAVLTVEGDPTYFRYDFDGARVLVVEDGRADEFGREGVTARSCAGLEPTEWMPEPINCVDAEHPGFPEATR